MAKNNDRNDTNKGRGGGSGSDASSSGAGKKYIAIGIVIAAVIGAGAIAIAAMSEMTDDLFEAPETTNTQIPDLDTGGTPMFPDTPASPSDSELDEQVPAPVEQASLVVSPSSASVGSQVAVQGTGFAPNDAIALFVDKQLVDTEPDLVIANPDGEFSATVIVPQVESGEYEVEAFGQEAVARTMLTVN